MSHLGLDTKLMYLGHCAASALLSIDEKGSTVEDLRISFQRMASNGKFGVSELSDGQMILLRLGLVHNHDKMILPTPFALSLRLSAIEHVTEVIAAMLSKTSLNPATVDSSQHTLTLPNHSVEDFDSLQSINLDRQLIGDMGEEHVLGELRHFYWSEGWIRLYPSIRRVSLISDSFGYDIEATTPSGRNMALEIKTSSSEVSSEFVFYISRNEYEVSKSLPFWRLVFCDFSRKQCSIAGWTFGESLRELCPSDSSHSRWESAQVKIPRVHLRPGIGSLVQSVS